MRISNTSKNTVLATDCSVAGTFLKRFMGLMGKKVLEKGSGLIITPCNSIHMCFMKFSLDVVFIDSSNTVVHIIEEIKPWRVSKLVSKAHSVIELPVGTIAASETQPGDRLEFK